MAAIAAPEALPPSAAQPEPAAESDAQADFAAAEAALVSKYGGLPKANPIFAHAVKKEKHYFDSGDWQLQQQGGMGQAGLPNFGEDTARRPLAYDHHHPTEAAEASRLGTQQPPKLEKRPPGQPPRSSSIGGKSGGSSGMSPRGSGAAQHAAAMAAAAAAVGETRGPGAGADEPGPTADASGA